MQDFNMRQTNRPAVRSATEQLKRAEVRATSQRVAVLAAMIQHGGHSSAEEVLTLAQADLPELNRSTVYRTLERLRDQRLISETDLGDGVRRFEVVDSIPHHHLVCTGCNAMIELDDAAVDALRCEIERVHGFRADIDHLAIFGRCPACQVN
jgi:Fe2+ or Zn2+ uptake regulation protein